MIFACKLQAKKSIIYKKAKRINIWTNSAKLRKFPGLYESVPVTYVESVPEISVLTEQFVRY